MSFKKYGLAAAVVMALGAGSAMAADPDTGTITFHGLVSNNTCKISMDSKVDQDGNDFDVTLDTVFVKDFASQLGDTSTLGEKQFTLNLTDCDAATIANASAQFDSGEEPAPLPAVYWFRQQTFRVQLKTLTWYSPTTVVAQLIKLKLTRQTTPKRPV